MKKSRRKFIKDTGLISSSVLLASNPSVASMLSQHSQSTDKDLVICIFQRGAADGLHSVVPFGDPNYFNLRPQIAVNNSINLDGFFGLNPELSELKSIWDAGDLGIIHAVGSTSDSRSHFDAQDNMEYANFNKNSMRTGWLAEYLRLTRSSEDTVFRAISMDDGLQKSIRGEIEALTISDLNRFDVLTHANLYEETVSGLKELYNNDDIFSGTTSVLFSAIDEIKQINPTDYPVENEADYQNDEFSNKLKSLGVIIKADLGAEIVTIDLGGWDHHNNIQSSYTEPAQSLAKGLLAFYKDMGERMNNITILCMTEFGRRAGENASLGTDHGHAGVMYAIGKQVNGSKVYGHWPGLDENNLNRGDLEVTTDYREVFSELLVKRLKYNLNINEVIPNFTYGGGIGIFK